ncbi:hypothetical protein BQ8420_02240 [Nocardiopsis sp. JB363]|nr:hypothetical protein BQ8420_02240 [Nocardiopsis sp. JB363]
MKYGAVGTNRSAPRTGRGAVRRDQSLGGAAVSSARAVRPGAGR